LIVKFVVEAFEEKVFAPLSLKIILPRAEEPVIVPEKVWVAVDVA